MEKHDFRSLLDKDRVELFKKRDIKYSVGIMLLDLFLIIAVAYCCEQLWGSVWFWPAYVFAWMFVGAHQVGIGTIAIHDGVHYLLCENKKLNDWLGKFVGTLLLLEFTVLEFDGFRDFHIKHHQYANLDKDSEADYRRSLYDASRKSFIIDMFLLMTGVKLLIWVFIGPFVLKGKLWIKHILFYGSVLALLVLSPFYDVARVLILYWVLPVLTWGVFVNEIRNFAEHYPTGCYGREKELPPINRTREVIVSPFDRLFVVTRGVNHHLTHHIFPMVPFYNMKKLFNEVRETEFYANHAHITKGYHRVLWEFFFQRNKCLPRES